MPAVPPGRCVATLRATLEPDPHNPAFIHTIRDIDYRFEFLDPTLPDTR